MIKDETMENETIVNGPTPTLEGENLPEVSKRTELEKEEESFVELSVQGTSFILLRFMVTETEWLLSSIGSEDENNVPWGIHQNGKYYIDADPQTFRWVLHFLK